MAKARIYYTRTGAKCTIPLYELWSKRPNFDTFNDSWYPQESIIEQIKQSDKPIICPLVLGQMITFEQVEDKPARRRK